LIDRSMSIVLRFRGHHGVVLYTVDGSTSFNETR